MRTSKLSVERDSVCAADDIHAPHTKPFAFRGKDTLAEVLSTILGAGYLANIAGGKATWIVEADGKPVAVVAQQWDSPEFLIDSATLVTDCTTPDAPRSLFFNYWCQVEPDIVFDCLRWGRPLPNRYAKSEL